MVCRAGTGTRRDRVSPEVPGRAAHRRSRSVSPEMLSLPLSFHTPTRAPSAGTSFRYRETFPPSAHVTGYWRLAPDPRWQTNPRLVVDFLSAGPPPVYVGFGSMGFGKGADERYAAVVEALAANRLRAVVTTGWGGSCTRRCTTLSALADVTVGLPGRWRRGHRRRCPTPIRGRPAVRRRRRPPPTPGPARLSTRRGHRTVGMHTRNFM